MSKLTRPSRERVDAALAWHEAQRVDDEHGPCCDLVDELRALRVEVGELDAANVRLRDELEALRDQFRTERRLRVFAVTCASAVVVRAHELAAAIGEQLDALGTMVDERRDGRDDEAFRLAIQAKLRTVVAAL